MPKKLLAVALDARHRATLEAIKANEGISLAAAARRCIDQVARGAELAVAAIPRAVKPSRSRRTKSTNVNAE